ncbi:MAG: CPBP family intramembrane metalloprotease [Gammaproteobacteria bacterium]|nr:CPBP family intramembrane metalloprotease [Gammaproteobacteria bacterium]
MQRVWHFPALIGATLLGGALLAWPLYVLLQPLFTPNFQKLLTMGTLGVGIALALLYVLRTGPLNPVVLGLRWQERFSREPAAGFVCGFLILALIELSLLLLDVHEFQHNREYVRMYVVTVVVQAFIFGLVIALVEELFFRGALFAGLLRTYGRLTAMILTSATYAAAHFLKYPDPLPGQELHWYTGIEMFPTALRWFASTGTPQELLSLFLFGMLLALVRLRRDSLWPCIGIHAGLVTGYKIAAYFTDRAPGSAYEFLLSSNSPVLGWLAVAWIGVALALCHRYCPQRTR